MDPLLEQFLGEARENLSFIEQNIEGIGGDDPELLNSVFRAAHTLKGGSGIVGFESVKVITHHAEDLLDMLRAGKIEFVETMTEVLYDAFDEVLNLIEAAEESGGIVDADEDRVNSIVEALSEQMGKELEGEAEWTLPFNLIANKSQIVDFPFAELDGTTLLKIRFKNNALDESFVNEQNFYAVSFDIDESCMVYGNDPIYALSLLGKNVVGISSCITDDNSKAILSGTEDEDGLLLKTQLMAFVYGTYEEIEEALFNFSDEIELLPLDIETMLGVNIGDSGHSIDSLKELSDVADDFDLQTIADEVKNSLELIGSNTLQYAQLQRFLNISALIKDEDTTKLGTFFKSLYKGEVYSGNQGLEVKEVEDTLEVQEVQEVQEAPEQEIPVEEVKIDNTPKMDAAIKDTLQNMFEQQYKALNFVETQEDITRVSSILIKMKKFLPEIPESFSSKEELSSFIAKKLGLDTQSSNEKVEELQEAVVEKVEVKEDKQEEKVEEKLVEKKAKAIVKKVESKDDKKSVVGKTVKIDQESIDSLMNVVGELLVAKNSLPYLADNVIGMTHDIIKREIMEKYIFINRLSEQLQDLIMGMRMLPISYVFDRYPKLVRDISKKLGKKVKLDMSGGDTKLDKNMIEMLADPMIHIMRNSLDHGIEMPDVREKKGKDLNGLVKLSAFAQSDKIIIQIIDDGAGINVQRVADKVLEKGLMTSEEIDKLSEDEMAELVLMPGLSTAEEITEFSGRGVGMDVVKKSIEGFGGTIGITTKANIGTTITLSIPVSLAVTSLLHISMDNIHYGIPMESVSETVKITKDEIEYLHNEPFIYIRGEVIPLLFIDSMLDKTEVEDQPLSIVVLNIKGNMLAVVVNEFLGQLDVVQKPLVGIMEAHPLFSGTALLGNGQIIMSMDPLGLLGISAKLKESNIQDNVA